MGFKFRSYPGYLGIYFSGPSLGASGEVGVRLDDSSNKHQRLDKAPVTSICDRTVSLGIVGLGQGATVRLFFMVRLCQVEEAYIGCFYTTRCDYLSDTVCVTRSFHRESSYYPSLRRCPANRLLVSILSLRYLLNAGRQYSKEAGVYSPIDSPASSLTSVTAGLVKHCSE